MFLRLSGGRIINTEAIGLIEELTDGRARLHVAGQSLEVSAEDWRRVWEVTFEPVLQSTLQLLESRDDAARAQAIESLGQLAEPRAATALLSLLGNMEPAGKSSALVFRTISELASQALRQLGQNEIVMAFDHALEGDVQLARDLEGTQKTAVAAALLRVLDSNKAAVVGAATALAELGVVDALPKLREKTVMFRFPNAKMEQEWREAVTKLERLAALPRPAGAKDEAIESLPRSVGTSEETISVG